MDDMDTLWQPPDEEDGDEEEYQDALGNAQRERMQPLPPRDMREGYVDLSLIHI